MVQILSLSQFASWKKSQQIFVKKIGSFRIRDSWKHLMNSLQDKKQLLRLLLASWMRLSLYVCMRMGAACNWASPLPCIHYRRSEVSHCFCLGSCIDRPWSALGTYGAFISNVFSWYFKSKLTWLFATWLDLADSITKNNLWKHLQFLSFGNKLAIDCLWLSCQKKLFIFSFNFFWALYQQI